MTIVYTEESYRSGIRTDCCLIFSVGFVSFVCFVVHSVSQNQRNHEIHETHEKWSSESDDRLYGRATEVEFERIVV